MTPRMELNDDVLMAEIEPARTLWRIECELEQLVNSHRRFSSDEEDHLLAIRLAADQLLKRP